MAAQKSIDRILADPIVRQLNPAGAQFLKAHSLSSRIAPFPLEVVALTVQAFPNLKVIPAFDMLVSDHLAGLHDSKDTLIVPSSGNTAYAIARLAPSFGFSNTLVVVGSDVPEQKREVVRSLPQASIVEATGNTMDYARRLERQIGSTALVLDQYSHATNQRSHAIHTGPELWRAMEGRVDIVAVALGSAGTAMGVSAFLRNVKPQIRVIGCQPAPGEQAPGTRDPVKIRIVPFDWRSSLDLVVYGTQSDALAGMHMLGREIDPAPGPSSGFSFRCLARYFESLPPYELESLRGKRAAILCHDTALLYSDWIEQNRRRPNALVA